MATVPPLSLGERSCEREAETVSVLRRKGCFPHARADDRDLHGVRSMLDVRRTVARCVVGRGNPGDQDRDQNLESSAPRREIVNSRELLRTVADAYVGKEHATCDADGCIRAKRAAALRALADRFYEEMARAIAENTSAMRTGDYIAERIAYQNRNCLARLDASPIAPPGEPTCATCGGTREIHVPTPDSRVVGVDPCPDCAPVDPEVPRCPFWCGGKNTATRNAIAQHFRVWCSDACANAGHPLHPAQPGGGSR